MRVVFSSTRAGSKYGTHANDQWTVDEILDHASSAGPQSLTTCGRHLWPRARGEPVASDRCVLDNVVGAGVGSQDPERHREQAWSFPFEHRRRIAVHRHGADPGAAFSPSPVEPVTDADRFHHHRAGVPTVDVGADDFGQSRGGGEAEQGVDVLVVQLDEGDESTSVGGAPIGEADAVGRPLCSASNAAVRASLTSSAPSSVWSRTRSSVAWPSAPPVVYGTGHPQDASRPKGDTR
jgi:hypothetical protein